MLFDNITVAPSPSKERGTNLKREASPLLDSLYSGEVKEMVY